jgi:hypothetical protein
MLCQERSLIGSQCLLLQTSSTSCFALDGLLQDRLAASIQYRDRTTATYLIPAFRDLGAQNAPEQVLDP